MRLALQAYGGIEPRRVALLTFMAATRFYLSLASDASLHEDDGTAGLGVEIKLHAEYEHQRGTLDVVGILRASLCMYERDVHQAELKAQDFALWMSTAPLFVKLMRGFFPDHEIIISRACAYTDRMSIIDKQTEWTGLLLIRFQNCFQCSCVREHLHRYHDLIRPAHNLAQASRLSEPTVYPPWGCALPFSDFIIGDVLVRF